MLVLTRSEGEKIIILKNIEISVLKVKGDKVKIGVKAPKSIQVQRKEILDNICELNKKSTLCRQDDLTLIKEIFPQK